MIHRSHLSGSCLHLAQLPLQIFSRQYADGKQPLALVEEKRVILMNEAAAARGLHMGNTADIACSLHHRITCLERDTEGEQAALANLAQWAQQFTSRVSLQPPCSLLLEVSGSLLLFGGEAELLRRLEFGLSDLGYSANLALAPTPMASLLAARAGIKDARGRIEQSLGQVPVELLEIEETLLESLHQPGIRKLAQLLKLPVADLSRRYGKAFVDYLLRLTGASKEPRDWVLPDTKFRRQIHFLADLTDLHSLIFPMRRLLSELEAFLLARQASTDRPVWLLAHRVHGRHLLDLRLAAPDNDMSLFLELTRLRLEQYQQECSLPEVDSLGLSVLQFTPSKQTSGSLLPGHHYQVQEKAPSPGAGRLLSLLSTRLGDQSCHGLALDNDHRPEYAWRKIRFDKKLSQQEPDSPPLDCPRPLFLLQSPKRLPVSHVTTSDEGGLSPELQLANGHRIQLLRGPERIDCGWWDNHVCRDYYVARHEDHALYWLFTDDCGWFVHGIFS